MAAALFMKMGIDMNLNICSTWKDPSYLKSRPVSEGTSHSSVTEHRVCAACAEPITDKYLLQVSGRAWHSRCLRCCVCQLALDRQPSCFVRDHAVYCKADYAKSFGAKCAKCCRAIAASDWVRKARDHVYHLACFACDACKRQLSTGEEFALHDERVLCKTHYLEVLDGGSTSSDECCDAESYHKSKTKRVRTTFTEEQLQVLQANFQLDSNPDGQDLERIAQITGLSKRVTQVWFQNSRARQKKHLHTGKMKAQQLHHHPAGAGTPQLARDVEHLGRHINLHLTYSLQAAAAAAAAAAAGAAGVHAPHAAPPPPPAAPRPHFASHGTDSSMDDLSQDSMGNCMRAEV